jgi:multidrug resistance efflux pump
MAIHQLKNRTLADKFANDVRASRRKKGRYIYILLVLGAFVYIGDKFLGPYVWLDAGGLVSADRTMISVPDEAQVLTIDVTPGEKVHKGEVLATVHSSRVTQNVADLKTRYADAEAKAAELNIKRNVANAVAKVAAERLKVAEDNLKKLSTSRAFVTDLTYQASIAQLYQAQFEVATQKAQREGSVDQLQQLNTSMRDAENAINDIEARYNGGVMRAPDDGIIGSQTASVGDVLRPGDLLLELYTGRRYVLAYLETDTLYTVHVGDKVHVTAGFRTSDGLVTELRPFAVQLPPEFQKTFRPRGRGQVAKIEFQNSDFPLSTKVQVTSDEYVPEIWRTPTLHLLSYIEAGWARLSPR